jgi:hypothetical protein
MTREALRLALEALENINNWLPTIGQKGLRDYEADAITAIKAALAEPEHCTGCEGKPSNTNNPCAVCGKAQPEQDPEQWQKRHPLRTQGKWENTNEPDAKWWQENAQGWDIRALFTSPPKRQPDDNGITVDLLEKLKATLTRLGYATPEGGLEQFGARLSIQLYNLCRAVDGLLEAASPPKRQPLTLATIADAPGCLNTNDKAMWVIGWNECVEAHDIGENQ